MRKKSTRLLSAALAVCMMLSVLPVGAFAAEPGAEEQENGASAQADPVDSEFVEINDTNFPDPVFQKYVKDNIDKADTTGQKDGILSQAERDAVTEINIDNQNCTDLTGIAYFANLTTLRCQQNGLEELNLEYNKNLTNLNCSYNKLTTLDVSKNAKLSTLECSNNGMEELNLGDITSLEHLFCPENNLTELDVSKNRYLEQLHCRYNNLRRLVIGNNYSLTMLYLLGNHLTSLDLYHKSEIWNYDYATQSYTIDVNDDGTFDLDSLPEGFDASKTTDWEGGTRVGNTLNVNSHEVQYTYNTGSWHYRQKWMYVKLKVNGHKYQWKYDNARHWRTCELSWCPGLTSAQRAEAPHDYTDATDPYCDTCGYVRSMHSVITGENVTAELEDKVLNVPVAADTKVHLTATVPEGKRFTGWTVKVGGEEKEADTFLTTPDKNDPTKATFTMPSENVEVTANFASNPTLNPTLRVGDHVTATIDGIDTPVQSGSPLPEYTTVHLTATAPDGQHFISWTVLVGGEEQKADTFLKTPDADDPTKVTFTMPSENVEVTANFASNPTLNPTLRVGDHVTATIEGSDASVPSGSTVPVPKNKIVHLTATAPGQHFISWTVKVNGVEQDPTFLKPDADDPTKVTFIMPDANVEVTATFADDPIGPDGPDPVGPSDTGNIQGAISAVVVGAAAGAIIYEAGTGIYRVINMPGIPMPSNRIELAELLWEHAGKPEPVSTALYSDIDEGDTDAQKAARWAVEQDLMKDDADNNKFHPAFPVSKLRTCLTWNAAKEKGLFDKTEE